MNTRLVPINAKYPIETLMEALTEYVKKTRRRVSFEWALMDGVNDTEKDVEELIPLCIPLEAHVNLIPLNPTLGWSAKGSGLSRVESFADGLADAGIAVSIRDNRGTNIDAACGQLAGLAADKNLGERYSQDISAKMDIGALLD